VETPDDEAEAFIPVVSVVEEESMPDPPTVDAQSEEDIARERAESVLFRQGAEMGLIPQADVSAVSGSAPIEAVVEEEEKHDIPLTSTTTVVTGSNIQPGAPLFIPPPPPPPSKPLTGENPALSGLAAELAESREGLKPASERELKPKSDAEIRKEEEAKKLAAELAKRRGTVVDSDDEDDEREKEEELKEKQEEAQREAQAELEKQNEILEELRNQNLALIRKLHQSGRTPQFIDVVKIEAADITKAKEQRLALQKVPKATTVKVKQARDKKIEDIAKVKDLIAKAKADGKSTAGLQGDLDKFLNTTTMKTPEGVPIIGTGQTKIAKPLELAKTIRRKPIFDDTIDYVATALDLWMRCKNASKANPKKGPCGRMGKGKLKRMTQKEAMMAVEKLEKKLVKLS
jgi:hypothetical protein